jgi:hypothetical protein
MLTEFIKVFCNLFICLRTDLYIHYSVHALFFLRFPITYHYVLSSVLWCTLRFPDINDAWSVLASNCLFALVVFVFAQWCATHIALCFCFVFLHFVYLVLPDPLDWFFWSSLQWSLMFISIHKSYNVNYMFDKYNWFS